MDDKAAVLEEVLHHLLDGKQSAAVEVLTTNYPHKPIARQKRNWTHKQAMQLFRRDGFTDRYSGKRLLFPGALKVLSLLMPEHFPAHPNWKMDRTHIAYWELFPTVDHVVPIARGGKDELDNWVTTSMLGNQAKSNWTLEELGWRLYPEGDFTDWDGLTQLTLEMVAKLQLLQEDKYLINWCTAAQSF